LTLFINLRRAAVGGGLPEQAYLIEGAAPSALKTLTWPEAHAAVRGKRLLIFCHGFNVSMQSAVRGAVVMEGFLSPADDEVFLAVLWPGDWHIPVINYSFEHVDAMKSGRLLARFLEQHCAHAADVSLGSHSLGGRVVLETLAAMKGRVRQMCVAAPAVDADCLSKKFAPALSRVERLTVLSSEKDTTLRWAYPLGDFFSDVFGDDDSAFRGALGLRGPRPNVGAPVHAQQIPASDNYDHGHYFPGPPIPAGGKPQPSWVSATRYWASAMRGEPNPKW